jgi:HEAT repeats
MKPGGVEALRGTATTSAAPRGAARTAERARRLGSAACLLLALSLVPADPIEGSGIRPVEWAATSPPTLQMTDGRLTARLADVPLERVLDSLADLTGARIDVDVMPGERVTEAFIDLPIEESLRRLLPGRQIIVVYEQAQHDDPFRLVAVRAYDGSGSSTRARRDRRDDLATPGARMPVGAPDGMLDLPADREALALVVSTSEDREARRRAIEELGRLDGDGITAALSLGLEDADSGVRESAARALGRTWDEGAIEPLAWAVIDDGDADVREAAAQALGRLWSESAVDALGRALLTDPLRAVREAAARALGDIGGTRGVSALIAALRDPRGSVRECAVAALAAIGGNVAVQALVEVSMADRDPWVREEAAAALEETTEP